MSLYAFAQVAVACLLPALVGAVIVRAVLQRVFREHIGKVATLRGVLAAWTSSTFAVVMVFGQPTWTASQTAVAILVAAIVAPFGIASSK